MSRENGAYMSVRGNRASSREQPRFNFMTVPITDEETRRLNEIATHQGEAPMKVLRGILEKGLNENNFK